METQRGLPCHFFPGGYVSSFLDTVLLSIQHPQQKLVGFPGLGPWHLLLPPTPGAIFSLLHLSYFLHGSFQCETSVYILPRCLA